MLSAVSASSRSPSPVVHDHTGMFIPRTLAKRVPQSTISVQKPETPLFSSVSVDSQPGPSSSKKRTVEVDESSDGSSDDATSSDGEDEDGDSDEEPEGDEKQAGSVLTTDPKGVKVSHNKAREQQIQSEIAARLELALSDLSLWRTEHLFQRLSENQEWYIPFSRLHDHPFLSPYLSDLSTRIPDAALVNALRTYGSGAFESRMKIRTPSNAAWKGKAQAGWVGAGAGGGWVGAAGGYEVRCKAWSERGEGWMDELGAVREGMWSGRMVYVEHVPVTIRSIWTLYHYITALARACQPADQATDSQLVQDIFVPTSEPTITERPLETMHRFRGQAFVVFSTTELAQAFTSRWTWGSNGGTSSVSSPVANGNGKWNTDDAVAAATSSGLRSVTKARWDELKSEYLAHQARVLKQNQRAEPRRPPPPPIQSDNNGQTAPSLPPAPAPTHKPIRFGRPPPFPPGILVFVRRLHPETNKTTLKTLFGRAFSDGSGDGIEYLDFQKGIDSAHIRLRTPSDASTLVKHFTSHPLVQKDALDSEGKLSGKEGAIEMEIVGGVRELNYWEKVPEKVRMAAVSRAGLGGDSVGGDEKGRRKRQRKG